MEKYIKKYFWTLNLVTIAICAYLGAKSVNTFVGAAMDSGDLNSAPPAPAPVVEKVAQEDHDRKTTLDPWTGKPLEPPKEVETKPEEVTQAQTTKNRDAMDFTETANCPKTGLQGELLATMAASNPFMGAFVVSTSDKENKMYEVGDAYPGGATVYAVARHKVFLDVNGRIECLIHGEEAENKPKRVEETPPPQDGGDLEDGIRKVSESEYIVSNETIQGAMENLNVLATQARIVPSFANGQANGFRVYSIKPGSFYDKLGLKNGDVVQRINGMDINSPEKALQIYSQLRTEKNISMDLLRRGSKVSVNYTIQ